MQKISKLRLNEYSTIIDFKNYTVNGKLVFLYYNFN